ncbi:hypothetical protein [Kitasatospora sp. NBC_01266]|uniref:hypothetical protein n=1 Tax=Kitasatospora sp. NBC_01266 TaxID=2903572 RepID=UPI002E329A09|nr:hypothetical protein [Kitasatospora sp. NBC_01266]
MERAFEYPQVCTSCGHEVTGWQGQELRSQKVGWFIEWECPNCGTVSDDHGTGPGPEALRQGLLAKFGAVGIQLTEGRDGSVAAVRRLREVFGYSPGEALAKFRESKSGGTLGTAVEVAAVVDALRRDGYAYAASA